MKPLSFGRVLTGVNLNHSMKKFSRSLYPLAGFVLLAVTVLRGEEPVTPPPARSEHREEMKDRARKMARELDLTADQKIQVEAIFKQMAEELKTLRGDASLTADQKRTKVREVRKSHEEQVDALLTPEQKVKAKEMRAAKRDRHGPDDRPGEKPLAP